MDEDIQRPLTLVMPVARDRLEQLKMTLQGLTEPENARKLEAALDKVGTVHATRFVLLEDDEHRWAKLLVIAIYDGTFDDYIAAFAREIGPLFDALLACVVDSPDKPSLPVERNVETLTQYIRNRDVPPANGRSYSSYPDRTALDLYEATRPRNDVAPAPRR